MHLLYTRYHTNLQKRHNQNKICHLIDVGSSSSSTSSSSPLCFGLSSEVVLNHWRFSQADALSLWISLHHRRWEGFKTLSRKKDAIFIHVWVGMENTNLSRSLSHLPFAWKKKWTKTLSPSWSSPYSPPGMHPLPGGPLRCKAYLLSPDEIWQIWRPHGCVYCGFWLLSLLQLHRQRSWGISVEHLTLWLRKTAFITLDRHRLQYTCMDTVPIIRHQQGHQSPAALWLS